MGFARGTTSRREGQDNQREKAGKKPKTDDFVHTWEVHMSVLKSACSSFAVGILLCTVAAPVHAVTIEFSGNRQSSGGGAPFPDARCPTGALLVIPPGDGTSNLGPFTHDDSHCINTGVVYDGRFNWDFGAGHSILGTFTGSVTFPTFSETFVLTGGTGRYYMASGSFLGTGTVTPGPAGTSTSMDFLGRLTLVPEPGSLALLLAGLAGLGLSRRRRAD